MNQKYYEPECPPEWEEPEPSDEDLDNEDTDNNTGE